LVLTNTAPAWSHSLSHLSRPKNITRSTTHWGRFWTNTAWLSHFCPSTAGFRARKCQSRVVLKPD